MDQNQLYNLYYSSAERNRGLFFKEKKSLTLISVLRLAVFFAGIFVTVFAFSFGTLAGIIAAALSISAFLFLIYLFVIHSERKAFYENLMQISEKEMRALKGNFTGFSPGDKWVDTCHNYSHDIDLFGDHSLFQFIDRTVTGNGREKLACWLFDTFSLSDKINIRQEAIAELSEKFEWRQEFLARAKGKSLENEDIQQLIDWLSDNSDSGMSAILKVFLWTGPCLAIISLILLVSGLLPYPVFTSIFLINLMIILGRFKSTGEIHNQVSRRHLFLSSLISLLVAFKDEPFKSALLSEIKKEIATEDVSAVISLKKLSRIIRSFDSRLNMIVGFLLNGLLLWDLHCIRSLEKWKEESKTELPEWLEKIGEVDALISLANFAFNNPDYCYPLVSTDESVFSAKNLAHPLLDRDKRVANDFIISERGKVILITGANMSGKSTFLRTVAVNLILAMAGAPVCAEKMKFIPLKLFTSMRTTDSLSHNESYFYAELKRLKVLKTNLELGEPVFFILDEILKGTNSVDKSIGSKKFTAKIIELGGTGMIATHDTSLCELEESFPDKVINKCFELEIDGENISFDYKLIDGVTRKMNAALLMKQMGIA